MKSFSQLLIESEKEYEYNVLSTEDIHIPERMTYIKWAANPYKCMSIQTGYYKPPSKENVEFSSIPNSPTYCVKLFLGIEVEPRILEQQIKMRLNFRKGDIKVVSPDVENDDTPNATGIEPYREMGELSHWDGFKQVADGDKDGGEERVGEFMKELMAQRKLREKLRIEKQIYETICIPYDTVKKLVNEEVRSGFYTVDLIGKENITEARICGPYKELLTGITYKDTILENSEVSVLKRELNINNLDEFMILIS